ncbi:unnamed protein product, partial [Sphacelaria rigidula]
MPNSYVVGERAVLQKSKAKLFDLVCENATNEQWAEWLRVPLEHAAASRDVALVNDLLAAGANGKAGWKGCHSRTLLCAAVQGGNPEVVKALLEAGSQPDVNVLGGKQLRSPLHYAALNRCEAIAEVLLLSGASPDRKDSKGHAPIHLAVSHGCEGIVSLLLKARAEVDVRDSNKNTALHRAAQMGRLSLVTGLLIAGASTTSRDKAGNSSLDFAVMGGHVDIIRLLGQRTKTMSRGTQIRVLHLAVRHNQAAAVDALAELGCDVRVPTNTTPLHFAAFKGSCEVLFALLRHKANVHAKRSGGESPLMSACMYLHQEAADLLLRWGADETAVDDNGHSAEQWIGAGLEKSTRERRRQDMDSMRKLLANAPADRAWRRRGWLVLYRAFGNKAWFGTARNQDGGHSMAKKG